MGINGRRRGGGGRGHVNDNLKFDRDLPNLSSVPFSGYKSTETLTAQGQRERQRTVAHAPVRNSKGDISII